MKPGSDGLVGSGIYFATNPNDTDHKCMRSGAILRCLVYVGRVKTVPPDGGDYTYESLQKEGFDSIMIPRYGGKEYVIFNPKQIREIQKS